MQSVPVIIVGGGPGGLTLAIELGKRGIECVVFNDKPGTVTLPAANATQARTMEHFRRLGFSQELRALGMPRDYPTDITYFTRYSKYELARFALPPSGAADKIARQASGSWSTPELPHRCSQLFIEQVLYKHAGLQPDVSLRFGWSVIAFEDDGEGVNVTAEKTGGTERITLRCAYLVGVDGARSMVREGLGLELEGERKVTRNFVGGRMIALYIRAPDLYKKLAGAPAWMYWSVNGERRSFMTAIDGVETFAFHTQLKVDEERRDISDDEAKGFFEQSMGCACDIEIMGKSNWNAGYTLVANHYKRGRAILAGDAVHLFTPPLMMWSTWAGSSPRCSMAGAVRDCSKVTRPNAGHWPFATPASRVAMPTASVCSFRPTISRMPQPGVKRRARPRGPTSTITPGASSIFPA